MPSHPTLSAATLLRAGAVHTLHRGIAADGTPCVAKSLSTSHADARHVASLVREAEVLALLAGVDGVVRLRTLAWDAGRPTLLLDDVGPGTLADALAERTPLAPESLVPLALRIARALAVVHRRGVLHRDLHPGNVVLGPDGPVIIDFGLSLRRGDGSMEAQGNAVGRLPFVPPEQTGRTSLPLDERSDLYALGAVLHAAATGRAHFEGGDVGHQIHAILCEAPPPIDVGPPGLSALVAQLLSKDPSDRPRSADVVVSRLLGISAGPSKAGHPAAPVAPPTRVSPTGRLFGRDAQLRTLRMALHGVSGDSGRVVVLRGADGSGRRALACALEAEVINRGGVFACAPAGSGPDVPLRAWRGALGAAAQHLSSRADGTTLELGHLAAGARQIIPEIAVLLPAGSASVRPPEHAGSLRDEVIAAAVRALARQAAPLVLVIEHLERCGAETLSVLGSVAAAIAELPVLLVATVADGSDDIDAALADIGATANLEVVGVEPLGTGDIRALCADALYGGAGLAEQLAVWVARQGRGLPGASLRLLREESAAGRLESTASGWQWTPPADSAAAESLGRPPGVVRLLAAVDALGGDASLHWLTRLLRRTSARVLSDAWLACERGELQPTGDAWRLPRAPDLPPEVLADLDVRFALTEAAPGSGVALPPPHAHAFVEAAVELLLAEAPHRRSAILAGLARLDPDGASPERRDSAASIGHEACLEALRLGAFEHALVCGRAGLRWAPGHVGLLRSATVAAAHLGRLDEAAALRRRAHEETRGDALMRAKIDRDEITLAVVAGAFVEALVLGRAALDRLGSPLGDVGRADALRAEVTASIKALGTDALMSLPPMRDPRVGAELDLQAALVAPSFFVEQPLFQLLVPMMVERMLAHGAHRGASYPLTFLGFLIQEDGDPAAGRAVALAGVALAEALEDPSARCRSTFVYAHHVQHWGGALATNLRLLEASAQYGQAAGDLQWAGYALVARHMNLWSTGRPLPAIQADNDSVVAFLARTNNHPMLELLQGFTCVVARLTGRPAPPAPEEEGVTGAMFVALQLQALVCEGRLEEAWEMSERAAALAPFQQGTYIYADAIFYTGLAAAGTGRREALAAAAEWYGTRLAWAPGTFGHRAALLRGLMAEADGDLRGALAALDQAAVTSRDGGWLPEAALAFQASGRIFEDIGAQAAAGSAREHAILAWQSWGASALVWQMRMNHPHLSSLDSLDSASPSRSRTASTAPVDLEALLEAGQLLAGEVDEERLIECLLGVLGRVSGATAATLLRPDEGALVVVAVLDDGELSWPRDDFQGRRAPHALVEGARDSLDAQVLSDARTDARTRGRAWRFRSALCLPVVRHGTLSAMVFLENRSLRGAFPPRQVALLQGLAGQVAAALETSMLFAALRREGEERVEAERALQRAQRLQTLGQVSGGVAHDFNNLLAVILGWADILCLTSEEGTRTDKAATQIKRAALRGSELTRQLLAYSRRSSPMPEAVALPEQVESLVQMADRVVSDQVQLMVTPAPQGLPPALVDPGLLEQVLMNLVVNARDAMPDGGRVQMSFGHVEAMPPPARGPGVVVHVEDEGMGIPPEYAERIFEPFFTTKGVDGTGLGLATCVGIVEQSGGAIIASSEPGRGSVFSVYLPIASGAVPPRAREPSAEVPKAPRQLHALVVEDDFGVRELFQAVLEGAGWAVSVAPLASEALLLLEDGLEPDVLLTDYSMPGMNGLEFVQRVRALRPGLPAVVISGLEPPTAAVAAGVRWEQKPFPNERLLELASEAAASAGAG